MTECVINFSVVPKFLSALPDWWEWHDLVKNNVKCYKQISNNEPQQDYHHFSKGKIHMLFYVIFSFSNNTWSWKWKFDLWIPNHKSLVRTLTFFTEHLWATASVNSFPNRYYWRLPLLENYWTPGCSRKGPIK